MKHRFHYYSAFFKSLIFVAIVLQCQESRGADQTLTLSEFFSKLKTISPIAESLQYETFPNFDFRRFVPESEKSDPNRQTYTIGSDSEKRIRTIIIKNAQDTIGVMNVYYFRSNKILTFKKTAEVLSEYPDFPIFFVSNDARFIVYLKKPFQYHKTYRTNDIVSVQVLRDDLFPLVEFTLRDNYVRMISTITYVNGQPTVIEQVHAIVIFQPEKDRRLLISSQTRFTEEYYVPKGDFFTSFRPNIKNDGLPYWLFANDFNH